ncbi:MAG: hypothetical protein IPH01_10795 [Elusimicrobia bacterium]|nr:hypothetical protein [Elusimicrobiota bacterium]
MDSTGTRPAISDWIFTGAHGDLIARWVGGPVEAVDGNDVAGELANILCCHVLPNLSPPALCSVSKARAPTTPRQRRGGPLAVTRVAMPTGWIEARVMVDPA